MIEVGRKYNRSTLFRMKKFYNMFSDEKVAPLAQQLSWSHYIELLALNDNNKIMYYINQCIKLNLSRNDLRSRIRNSEYERLSNDVKVKLLNNDDIQLIDNIKNPIIIENKYNYTNITEKVLKQLILENIPAFLKELGNGFTFIDTEYKIRLDDRYNYIDLLLYNIKYKCYVVVELKVSELKKEHIGQIMIYMNYIDKHLKTTLENETVGIIICRQDSKYVIKYCSDNRIVSREYHLI